MKIERVLKLNSFCPEIFTERQGKIAEESFLSDEEDWEGIEGTELERTFGKAASFLEKLVLDPTSNISNDLKLQFYGLYKQATEGPCASPQPPAYRPAARAKWCESCSYLAIWFLV
jgi:acyl-CoA-binding protein